MHLTKVDNTWFNVDVSVKFRPLSSPGIFPVPEKDPVIQIANMVVRQGDKDPFIRSVFTLNTCAPIVGADVVSFKREADLLKVCLLRSC